MPVPAADRFPIHCVCYQLLVGPRVGVVNGIDRLEGRLHKVLQYQFQSMPICFRSVLSPSKLRALQKISSYRGRDASYLTFA